LNHHFKEIKPVKTYDKRGKIIEDRKLHIAVPFVVKKQDCLDMKKSVWANDKGIFTEKVRFKDEWDSDLFSVLYVSPYQDSLVCSEKAKSTFEKANIRGIKYIPAEEMMSLSWILEDNERMYLPRGYEPV